MIEFMVKRVYIAVVNLILMSALFFSCVKEGMDGYADNSDEIKIVGSKGENISRSVPPNANFKEGIRYRLWAYDNSPEDGKYLFNNGTQNGIVAKESVGHYIEMDDANRSRLVDNFTIYGLTDNITTDSVAFTPKSGTTTGYTFSIGDNDEVIPSDIGSVNRQLTDYYRGKFEYVRDDMPIDSKGLIVMNFKHIMSQLKISILQQPDENTGEIYEDLKVTKIELAGDYSSMDYDVKTDAFSNPVEYSDGSMRTLWEYKEVTDNTDNDITENVKYFVTSTVFPTLNADDSNSREYYLYLTLGGTDAQKFDLENGKVKIKLTESGLGKTNLNFERNYSYHIQVFFMSGNVHVIAIRPEVYPWLDGETDNGEQGDMYEEVALGNTLLFDNLVWSDRNLGATEFDPVDEASFKNCTGFYYQFQRNIPYFPDQLIEHAKVYPVISVNNIQSYPPIDMYRNSNTNLVQDVSEIGGSNVNYGFGFSESIVGKKMWSDDVSQQPVPPGWRIPSSDDFLSIMPSCAAAGNITFLSWTKIESDKTGHAHANLLKDNNENFYNVISVKVPYDKNYDYCPTFDRYRYWGNNWRYATNYVPDVIPNIQGDPSARYSSVYVISKSDQELDNVDQPKNSIMTEGGHSDPSWGTIYAIKKIGTDEAYRMRWHIVRPIEDVDNYVLVISKYTASKTDELLFREQDKSSKYYYRNYNWDNPSAVMYIPIVGMVGSNEWNYNNNTSAWRSGQIGNFGTETLLLTTERIKNNNGNNTNNFKAIRIKIAGQNASNMFISVSQDFGGCGGQLRLVRDITN